MSDRPSSDRAEMIGFELTHALFRNELPRLAAAFDNGSDDLVDEITEDHLRRVTDHLVRHHDEEESFHFRLLADREPTACDAIRRLEAQHETLQGLLSAARDLERPRLARALALGTLVEATTRHLDTEDAEILPLLGETITASEQAGSMARSRAKIPADDEAGVLASMLAAATPDQLRRMLAVLPDEAVRFWTDRARPALDAVHDHLDRTAHAQRA